jgi:plastocyanin
MPNRSPRARIFSTFSLLSAATIATVACSKKVEPAAAPEPAANGTAATPAGAPSAGAFGKGAISGTARFTGKVPEARPITTPDPFCARNPIKEEDILVGANGGLKNVIVRVTKGAAGTYPAPTTPAAVDQTGCMYRPRAQVVMAGQPVQVRNGDQTLHNVHSYKGASTVFNQAQIPGMPAMTKTFDQAGQVIKFKCDVHPWMTGFVAVASNPFSAVSGDDGSFSIDKLPPGDYTLEAWHERLGTKTVDVKIPADPAAPPVKVQFDFAAP